MDGEILFLFNHDAPHQVAHIAGVARSVSDLDTCARVTCACATPRIRTAVEAIVGADAAARFAWFDFSLPSWQERALALPNRIAPVRRLRRLHHHAARLNAASVVVSAERTCLNVRDPSARARFVYIPHGAGDRSVAYHPGKGGFDAILVAGGKTAREMAQRGVAPRERLHVIGYPKFDTVDLSQRPKLFANDRPVFVYNPHFDPLLSSWYDEGPALLDWFASAAGQGYNLVFAPHIMLFRKKLHVSLEYRTGRLRPDIEERWRAAPNILIDTDGPRLVDMTYTLGADAYIGDVSSQIYEFLARPRAAYFLDTFSRDPRSREDRYPAWQAGPVAQGAADLTSLLPGWREDAARYRAVQERLFADTMSYDPARTASQRAARVVLAMASGAAR